MCFAATKPDVIKFNIADWLWAVSLCYTNDNQLVIFSSSYRITSSIFSFQEFIRIGEPRGIINNLLRYFVRVWEVGSDSFTMFIENEIHHANCSQEYRLYFSLK